MIEVVLDTETTGLSTAEKHRIVEIGCIELNNQIPTGKVFHKYINPKRPVSEDAYKIHGYSDEFLSKQKTFSEIALVFLNFIKNKKLIIHNAAFDLSFLNFELKLLGSELINSKNVIDTLDLARTKFPGSSVSLDALCKKFNINNSKREKHNALIDCDLLAKVYINLIDQKEPKLKLYSDEKIDNFISAKNRKYSKMIIKPNEQELNLHKVFLKKNFKKNFFKSG